MFGIKWLTQYGMQSLGDFLTLKVAFRHAVNSANFGAKGVDIPATLGLTPDNSLATPFVKDGKQPPVLTRSGNRVTWSQWSGAGGDPSQSFDVVVLRYR